MPNWSQGRREQRDLSQDTFPICCLLKTNLPWLYEDLNMAELCQVLLWHWHVESHIIGKSVLPHHRGAISSFKYSLQLSFVHCVWRLSPLSLLVSKCSRKDRVTKEHRPLLWATRSRMCSREQNAKARSLGKEGKLRVKPSFGSCSLHMLAYC